MTHNRGLTMVEALVAMFAIVILLTILLPMFSARRGPMPPRMASNSQMRGIHQSLIMYARHGQNNGYYPGLDSTGQPAGLTVEARFKALLDANHFEPDYLISPLDGGNKQAWVSGPFTSDHYSFALLQIPSAGGRYDEWRETLNPDAIVMSDRNTGTIAAPESVHTPRGSGDWRGGVVRNDNSVLYETTHLLDTIYAGHAHTDDHLFEAVGDDDAYLIHNGN